MQISAIRIRFGAGSEFFIEHVSENLDMLMKLNSFKEQ